MLNDREQIPSQPVDLILKCQLYNLPPQSYNVGLQKNISKKEFLTCIYNSTVIDKYQVFFFFFFKNKALADKMKSWQQIRQKRERDLSPLFLFIYLFFYGGIRSQKNLKNIKSRCLILEAEVLAKDVHPLSFGLTVVVINSLCFEINTTTVCHELFGLNSSGDLQTLNSSLPFEM